jgi:phospho-N-acetylmuramoyl-pentapeptide-transferase
VIQLFIASATAFVLAIGGTPLLIRITRSRGIGQEIRDDGPVEHPHVAKAGTPTMGGVAIVVAVAAGYIAAHIRKNEIKFATSGLVLMGLILAAGAVGFIDDYLGVRARRNLGLRKRGKFAGLLVIAVVFALLALKYVDVSTHLSFTRDMRVDLGDVAWVVWVVFIVLAMTNAVNFTDGLDGLAAGSGALVFSAFVIIAFWEFRHPGVYGVFQAQAIDLATIAGALVGACAGFLWWNAAPAQIFMGDTGSLALGAAMAGLAVLTRTQLLLPLLGGLYLVEMLSVLAQIISFRIFHRRVLRMAPIHHHFELLGWPEVTVIVRFWLFTGLLVAFGVGLFYANFIRIPGVID